MATNPSQYPEKNSADEQTPNSPAFAKKFNYSASTFESDKYKVTGLMYPNDLMSAPDINPYGGNKVVFYINTSVDSRIFKGTDAVAVVDGVQRNERAEFINQRITNAQAVGASGVASGLAAAGLGGALNLPGGAPGGAVVGTALGVGSAAVIASQASDQEVPKGQEKPPAFQRPQKRLKAAIALYIPNQLNIRYSTGWGEEDTFALSALAKGGEELGRALKGEGDIKRTGGLAGDVLGAMAINNAPLGQALGVAAGLAANPKKEQAFKSVDFRTFTFDYQFSPRDQNEAQNVMNIIRAFKYHMHPEFNSANKFLYIYPSEFDIAYYKGVRENLAIHRHTSCVLTEMNVNYTPNGVFTTFSDGTPTQMNVSLTFKELLLLSKETIERYM